MEIDALDLGKQAKEAFGETPRSPAEGSASPVGASSGAPLPSTHGVTLPPPERSVLTGGTRDHVISLSAHQWQVLTPLRRAGLEGLTRKELQDACGLCSVTQEVSRLRMKGYDIRVTHEGRTREGSSLFRYRLNSEP